VPRKQAVQAPLVQQAHAALLYHARQCGQMCREGGPVARGNDNIFNPVHGVGATNSKGADKGLANGARGP